MLSLFFLDRFKYLHLPESVIQSLLVGIEINIQVVLHHAAALVLYGIDDAVDAEPCSQGELVQISRDGVVSFGIVPE